LTRRVQGHAGASCHLKAHQNESGPVSGITTVAAEKDTRPKPAGKLMPIGKRVWLSPPVPTGRASAGDCASVDHAVPGTKRRRRRACNEVRNRGAYCVDLFGTAAVWQNDCITDDTG